MAAQDYKFEGWLGLDKESVHGKMVWQAFEPKAWEETDIDIQITHSGICGTDVHTLRSGWVREKRRAENREETCPRLTYRAMISRRDRPTTPSA
jgi:hypothetical protein